MKNQIKLYIPVLYEKKVKGKEDSSYTSTTLLNASKIPILKDILPTKEMLVTHVQIEKIKYQKDNNYRPKAFEIQIEESKFNLIISEVKKKNRKASGTHIALFAKYPGVPVALITKLSNK